MKAGNDTRFDLRAVFRSISKSQVAASALVMLVFGVGHSRAPAVDRPNVLWITAEDMSPTLGCYGDSYARTPNIDALALEGVLYTQAFATSPVCSPVRSCLINGCIASSQGTHNMRSEFPIPIAMRGFPALLRDAGYYTSNNVKTDYNSGNAAEITRASWCDSSETAGWRNRKAGEPFFSVFNLMTSHQSRSMVWSYDQFQREVQSHLSSDEIHDPSAAPLPPYYPDTPLIRKTVARFYDCVTVMDQEVGRILDQLEEDGLAEDTIVFFYSDHGSGMPRHKRALLDSGMRVPLLIRFPKKFEHLAPAKPGSSTDRLVSFDDFGPTVLSLAAVTERLAQPSGNAFLGPQDAKPRRYVHGHRDRVDEVIDMARSVRDKRFLYIRNYMPHHGYNQPSAWVDQSRMSHEFYRLSETGAMTPAQWHFAGPSRRREELYDCQADPLNLNDLSDSPDHRDVMRRMRTEHRAWVLQSRDLGFLPEIQQQRVSERAIPMEWAQTANYKLAEILDAASLVGTDDQASFRQGLSSESPAIRYWSAVGMSATERLSGHSVDALTESLQDDLESVQIESAAALARHGHGKQALKLLAEMLKRDDTTVLLHAGRSVELLGDKAISLHADMKRLFERFEDDPEDPAWFIRFTTTGFLNRVHPGK